MYMHADALAAAVQAALTPRAAGSGASRPIPPTGAAHRAGAHAPCTRGASVVARRSPGASARAARQSPALCAVIRLARLGAGSAPTPAAAATAAQATAMAQEAAAQAA